MFAFVSGKGKGRLVTSVLAAKAKMDGISQPTEGFSFLDYGADTQASCIPKCGVVLLRMLCLQGILPSQKYPC